MSAKIVLFATAFLLFSNSNQTNAQLSDVIEVVQLGSDIVKSLLKTWDIIDQTNLGGGEVDIPILKKKEKKILSRIAEVTRQIANFEDESMSVTTWAIESITENIASNTKLQLNLHELADLLSRIRSQHKVMRSFANNKNDFERSTLVQFAEWTTAHDTVAIQGLLDRVHTLVVGSDELRNLGKIGTLEMLQAELEEAENQVCSTQQSPQQVLYQLYNAVSVTEIKGYAMMQFSWMILRTFGMGNYTSESHLMRDRFNERVIKTQERLRKVMERASRIVHRCDPRHHVEGETFIQVTRLLQGFIQNEVDMNVDNTCRENCGAYQVAETYGCFKELYCAKQPKCSGKLLNCQFFDSDMWICPSKPSSLRRYEFIEYENGRILGKAGRCTMGSSKVDSWWRWLFWHCSYCLCICDEESSRSDRYFNLREVLTNTTTNRVLTGLRFRKVNRIIHIQVQQGELLPRGNINASSVEWVPIQDYRLLDRGIRNGIDYFTMNWTHRAIDLDDLKSTLRKDQVVTGVRFRTLGRHLRLEVRFTEFDFNTGKLLDESTQIWVSSENTENSAGDQRRTPVKLKSPDIPTLTRAASNIDSDPNQYIEFTHTDLDRDVGQTTVPFLDAQDVVSNPPVPISGLGVYHKGQPLYGGFVGFKMFTYDFEPHIHVPELNEEIDEVDIIPLAQ